MEGKRGIGRRYKTSKQKFMIIIGISALSATFIAMIPLLMSLLVLTGLADEQPVWDGRPICMWGEHIHTEECYPELICEIEEGHIHSYSCFTAISFSCGKEHLYCMATTSGSALTAHNTTSGPALVFGNECAECVFEFLLVCGKIEGHFHGLENGCFIVHPYRLCGRDEHICDWECIPLMFIPLAIGDRWDLTNFITAAEIRDANGELIPPGGAIVSGGTYSLGLEFRERWNFQFGYHTDGFLNYSFPPGIEVEDSLARTPIFGPNNIAQIGEFYIENSVVYIRFFNVWADGSSAPGNFIDVYTNATFAITVSASFNLEAMGGEFNLGNNISFSLTPARGEAAIRKTAGLYDPEHRSISYTLRITADEGKADIERVTDLARRAVTLDNLWNASGPTFAGVYPEIRNVTVNGPEGSIPFTLKVSAENAQMFEIILNEPYELDTGQEMSITYTLFMTDAITRLYGDPLREYSFSVHNEATVHYNDNMRAQAEATARIMHNILNKMGTLLHDGSDGSPPLIRWVVTLGDGNAVLSDLDDRRITDRLGGGVLLPVGMTANVSLYGRTGTYPNFTRGSLIANIPNAALTNASVGADLGFYYDIPQGYGDVYFTVMTFDTPVNTTVPVLRWQNTVIFHEVVKVASIATTPAIRLEDWIEIICSERIRITTEFYLGTDRQNSIIYLTNDLLLVAPHEFSDAHSYVDLFAHAENIQFISAVDNYGNSLMANFRLPASGGYGLSGQFINPADSLAPSAAYNVNLQTASGRSMRVLFGEPRQTGTPWMSNSSTYLKWPVNVAATIRYSYEVSLSTPLVTSAGAALPGTATLGDFLRDGYKAQSEVRLYQFNPGSGTYNQALHAKSNIGWPVTKDLVATRFGENGEVFFDYEVIWDGVRRRGSYPHDNPDSLFHRINNTSYRTMMPERFGPGADACFFDDFDSRLSYVPGSFRAEERFIEYWTPDLDWSWGTAGPNFNAWIASPENEAFARARNWGYNAEQFWRTYDWPQRYNDLARVHYERLRWTPDSPQGNVFILYPQELTWGSGFWGIIAPIFHHSDPTQISRYYTMNPLDWDGIRWREVDYFTPPTQGTSGSRRTLSGPLNLPASAGTSGPLRFTYTLMVNNYPTDGPITVTNTAEIRVHENILAHGDVPNLPAAYAYGTEPFPVITQNNTGSCPSCGNRYYCGFWDSTTNTFGSRVLQKGADHTANRIHYEIVINPEGATLRTSSVLNFDGADLPEVGNLLLEDIMDDHLAFFYDTLRVYLPMTDPLTGSYRTDASGNIIWSSAGIPITHNAIFDPDDLFTYTRTPIDGLVAYQPGKTGILLVLPNSTPLRLNYDARILNAVQGQNGGGSNNAAILGVANETLLYMENISALESWGAGSVESLSLFKIDSENRAVRLPGARFGLYIGFPDNPSWPYGETPTNPITTLETFTADNFTFYFLEEQVTGTGGFAEFHSSWLPYYGTPGIVFAMLELEAPPGYTEAVSVDSGWESVTFFALNPAPDIDGQKVHLVFNEITIVNESMRTDVSLTVSGEKETGLAPEGLTRDFSFTLVEISGLTDTRRMYRFRGGSTVLSDFERRAAVEWTDVSQQNGTFTFDLGSGFGPGTYYYMITEDMVPGWIDNESVFVAEVTVRPDGAVLAADIRYFIVDFDSDTAVEVNEIRFVNIPDAPPMGMLLPETGGSGRRVFQMGGVMLMFMATASIFTIKARNSSRTRKLLVKDEDKFEEVEFDKLE